MALSSLSSLHLPTLSLTLLLLTHLTTSTFNNPSLPATHACLPPQPPTSPPQPTASPPPSPSPTPTTASTTTPNAPAPAPAPPVSSTTPPSPPPATTLPLPPPAHRPVRLLPHHRLHRRGCAFLPRPLDRRPRRHCRPRSKLRWGAGGALGTVAGAGAGGRPVLVRFLSRSSMWPRGSARGAGCGWMADWRLLSVLGRGGKIGTEDLGEAYIFR